MEQKNNFLVHAIWHEILKIAVLRKIDKVDNNYYIAYVCIIFGLCLKCKQLKMWNCK